MVRWEPGAKERLQAAALDLFVERGFEQTTVQDIAARAGLTERTFFRHFADKREVLFLGEEAYVGAFLEGMRDAPEHAAALELVTAALLGAGAMFTAERRPFSLRRQQVIDANRALQERESLKRIALGDTLTAALIERGTEAADARLAAEIGVAAFSVAFRTWIEQQDDRGIGAIVPDVLDRVSRILPVGSST